ncbi:ABC transporter family protein [Mesorhizobium loti]|uniref:ABC transporter family protein n=1 Tax=Rhizobium loti TaxID=381 RepID=A0A8E2W536_RHILI|nr:ATP-binding cassette domain-containing protein [Mesorhizobium loti]PWJ84347.1 ABC transporter family protein [Mesorhizobium loti]
MAGGACNDRAAPSLASAPPQGGVRSSPWSGNGKTTLGRVITKLAPPTGGRLLFDGHDMNLGARLSSAPRPYRHNVQMILQDAYLSLNPEHTVIDIVAELLRSIRLVALI